VPASVRAVAGRYFAGAAPRDASAWRRLDPHRPSCHLLSGLKPQGLPADHRVRKRRDFERAYEEGKKVVTPEFALFMFPNGTSISRLGITTTRRLGKAVIRNRARRLVREAYRTNQQNVPSGYDMVVVVRAPLLKRNARELATILIDAARHGASAAGADG